MSSSVARHAIYHATAAQYIAANQDRPGFPNFDHFWDWITEPEQHSLFHAYMNANQPRSKAKARAAEFIAAMRTEYNRWVDAEE
jgi:hypothetical protein